ncbi:cupredoxin domain-containing protein [Candidatus Micrarchaeota archaeon]|nr:cupredoxin domain-containing protein [Candidatus Micrarchaeota archaeon]
MRKWVGLLVLFGVLLFGCASPQAPQNTQAPATAAVVSGGVQEISMTAKSFEFSPATFTVKKGVPVKLTITSEDVEHGFSISEFNVNAKLQPGQATVVQFTPDKAGQFTFFCSVVCGAGHGGMNGKLVVTE